MERADFTMEDWIQETCLISVVTSGPTEPKTFQEAWHFQNEKEGNNWRTAIRKEMRSMIDREVWRKTERKKILSDNLWTTGDQEERELEFFNMFINVQLNI